VFTVLVYGWYTVAAVNTRTRYIESMNIADNEATGRLLDGLIHHEVVLVMIIMRILLLIIHHKLVLVIILMLLLLIIMKHYLQ
jgi:hypothetical protein